MSKQKFLGEFEQMILLAMMRLGENAYGSSIRQLLVETIKRDVTVGALYTTLERLESKGLVSSRLGEATAERGGRAKRYFSVSAEGRTQLAKTKQALDTLWRDVALKPISVEEVHYG